MKGARWQSQLLIRLICLTAALLFSVLSAQAQTDAELPLIGGAGGGPFTARCPQGQFLTGFELRTGADIDAIMPMCITAYGPADIGPLQPYKTRFGGDGGGPTPLLCPRDRPVVIGMYVFGGGDNDRSTIVRSLRLYCGTATTTQRPDDEKYEAAGVHTGSVHYNSFSDWQHCPTSLVGVGIRGRSGIRLDAVGLVCGVPTLTPRAARPAEVPSQGAIGRRIVPGATTGAPTGPPRPVCDAAREARARNNAAAPGLEESCRAELAAKGFAIAQVDAVVAQARVAEPAPEYWQGFDIATGIFGDPALGANGNTATGAGSLGIRDSLRAAGQRGFNASVKLHLSRKYERTTATATASPNPVRVPTGQMSGATTISWKVPQGYTYCEIYLSVDNGQWSEFARGGDGSKAATIKLGSSHTFRMMVYEGQAGTPKIVMTLYVTAKN